MVSASARGLCRIRFEYRHTKWRISRCIFLIWLWIRETLPWNVTDGDFGVSPLRQSAPASDLLQTALCIYNILIGSLDDYCKTPNRGNATTHSATNSFFIIYYIRKQLFFFFIFTLFKFTNIISHIYIQLIMDQQISILFKFEYTFCLSLN